MPIAVIAYVGPMWSGKTTALLAAIEMAKQKGYLLGVFDHPKNTRNSSRDLSRRCTMTEPFNRDIALSRNYDVLLFDEVHFYSVFGGESDLLAVIERTTAKVVILSGIEKDFYHGFVRFPIWNMIADLGFKGVIQYERREMFPLQPCYRCGTWQGVCFTANTGEWEQRVGDNYVNCCSKCSQVYYDQWEKRKIHVAM